MRWKGTLALLALTAVAYGAILGAGWVLDDHTLILQNPALQSLQGLWSGLRGELWQGTGYWRPALILDFYADYQLTGTNPVAWHFGNLFWHLLNVGLLLGFLQRLGLEFRAALLGAAFFALHPIQSEAVCWVSARNDLLATAFSIGSLWMATQERRALAGGLLAGLALLSKESAIALPFAGILLADHCFPADRKPVLRYAAASIGTITGIMLLRTGLGLNPALPDPSPLLRALPTVLGSYLTRIFLPQPLFSQHLDDLPAGWTPTASLGLLLGLATLLLARRLPRLARVGIGISLLLGLPSLLAIASFGLAADRYLYLPMVGLSLLVASLPLGRWTGLSVIPAVGSLLILSQRIPEWEDGRTLFAAEASRSPSCYSATQAGILLGPSDPKLALKLLKPALNQQCPAAWRPAVEAALAGGQRELALALAGAARDPQTGPMAGNPAFEGLYAICLAANGRWEEARNIATGPAALLPRGEAAVVMAAAAFRQGDAAGVEEWQRWVAPDRALLGTWSARLLRLAGEEAQVDRLFSMEVAEPSAAVGELQKTLP